MQSYIKIFCACELENVFCCDYILSRKHIILDSIKNIFPIQTNSCRNLQRYLQTGQNKTRLKIFQHQTKETFAEYYFSKLLAKIDKTLRSLRNSRSNANLIKKLNQLKIKLSTLNSPSFSGKYYDWNAFPDQFNVLIHTN